MLQRCPVASTGERHLRRRRAVKLWPCLFLLFAACALCALPALLDPSPVDRSPSVALGDGGAAVFVAALNAAIGEIQPLAEQVEEARLIPDFGQRAAGILARAVAAAGPAGPALEPAVDSMLHSLFLRQLVLLRRQVAAQEGNPVTLPATADRQFLAGAANLLRPGSAWSAEAERRMLRTVLEGRVRRAAALAEERVQSSRTQRTAMGVIAELQASAARQRPGGRSPWALSASYRVPKTPLQLVGRYQGNRAGLELHLSPERDPANAEAGFSKGIGPANLGLDVSVG